MAGASSDVVSNGSPVTSEMAPSAPWSSSIQYAATPSSSRVAVPTRSGKTTAPNSSLSRAPRLMSWRNTFQSWSIAGRPMSCRSTSALTTASGRTASGPVP